MWRDGLEVVCQECDVRQEHFTTCIIYGTPDDITYALHMRTLTPLPNGFQAHTGLLDLPYVCCISAHYW
jgi:hypothetical protein